MTIMEEDIKNIISDDLPWEKLKGKSVFITGATGLIVTYKEIYENGTAAN